MVDVADAFQLGIALLDHRIKPRHHRALGQERRLKRAKALHGGVRAHVFVMVENDRPHLVAHGHDGSRKAAFFPSGRGALLTFHRIGVDVVTGEAVFGGNGVGTNALRGEVCFQSDAGVTGPCATVAAHRHAAHAFYATTNGELGFAGDHFGCRHIASLKARGAKAVDLHAGGGLRIIRGEDRKARNVAALFANGRNATQHHVIDQRCVQIVTVAQRLQRL